MSLTPREIFEEKISTSLKENPKKDVTAIYQFDITGDDGGHWVITLNENENKVENGSSEAANCTITMADKDLVSLVQGTLNAQLAFMTGKLKVKGDVGLALKLGSILKT